MDWCARLPSVAQQVPSHIGNVLCIQAFEGRVLRGSAEGAGRRHPRTNSLLAGGFQTAGTHANLRVCARDSPVPVGTAPARLKGCSHMKGLLLTYPIVFTAAIVSLRQPVIGLYVYVGLCML